MHVGRPYPYHPSYWATEGWFFPGFMPWKMLLTVFDNSTPPWGVYTSGYGEVSVPGTLSPDSKVITYEFRAHILTHGLILRCYADYVLGVKQCKWDLEIVGGALVWARAVCLQTLPQRIVFNRSWPYLYGGYPYPAIGPPKYQFTPALYADGGSPFPNY